MFLSYCKSRNVSAPLKIGDRLSRRTRGSENPRKPPSINKLAKLATNIMTLTIIILRMRIRKIANASDHHYMAEVRAKIAKYASEHANRAAVTKFSRELGHTVSEHTVRNVKSAYLSKLKSEVFPAISWLCRMLPFSKR